MQSLGRPEVLRSAAIAALGSAAACFPRLATWHHREYPLWYLETALFFGGIVLWAFVFAWHTRYSGGAVLTLKAGRGTVVVATISGAAVGLLLHRLLDPALRIRTPEDYPKTLEQWAALVLFTLAFAQLFLIFAPFAWCVRLCRNRAMAATLTVLFGVFVLALKNLSPRVPMPLELLLGLIAVRLLVGALTVYFFLRGGVLLAWWWGLLLESRHLWQLRGE